MPVSIHAMAVQGSPGRRAGRVARNCSWRMTQERCGVFGRLDWKILGLKPSFYALQVAMVKNHLDDWEPGLCASSRDGRAGCALKG